MSHYTLFPLHPPFMNLESLRAAGFIFFYSLPSFIIIIMITIMVLGTRSQALHGRAGRKRRPWPRHRRLTFIMIIITSLIIVSSSSSSSSSSISSSSSSSSSSSRGSSRSSSSSSSSSRRAAAASMPDLEGIFISPRMLAHGDFLVARTLRKQNDERLGFVFVPPRTCLVGEAFA